METRRPGIPKDLRYGFLVENAATGQRLISVGAAVTLASPESEGSFYRIKDNPCLHEVNPFFLEDDQSRKLQADDKGIGCSDFPSRNSDDPSVLWLIEMDSSNDGFTIRNYSTQKYLVIDGSGKLSLSASLGRKVRPVWKLVPSGTGFDPGYRRKTWDTVKASLTAYLAEAAAYNAATESSYKIGKFKFALLHAGADGKCEIRSSGAEFGKGIPAPEIHLRLRRGLGPQHLFVFVHGVDSGFGVYEDYVEWLSILLDRYSQPGTANGLDPDSITVLGVNWASQTMLQMLKSLATPGETMPAQTVAERGLSSVLNDLLDRNEAFRNTQVHLVGHSMGSQVLLYLLPKLSDSISVGSMLFLQGFAPSSAFTEEGYRGRDVFMAGVRNLVHGRLEWLYSVLAKCRVQIKQDLWVKKVEIDFDPETKVRGWISEKTDGFTQNVVKATDFHQHLRKVNGPIVATVTDTLWADYQVGAAEMSYYAPTGGLGVRGFVNGGTRVVELHELHDDERGYGHKRYSFGTANYRQFFNLRVGPYLTDHDDFKNRAIAFAHLRAAGLIADTASSSGEAQRLPPLPASPIRADRWMGDTWETIRARNLTQLCMPGSHDAGTGVITDTRVPSPDAIKELVAEIAQEKLTLLTLEHEAGDKALAKMLSNGPIGLLTSTGIAMAPNIVAKLSQTQVLLIDQQLRQGCRFFDLRPAWAGDGFYLAHGDNQKFQRARGKATELGFVGGIGEALDTVLEDICRFAKEPGHEKELIVLKFSHGADWSNPTAGDLSQEHKQKLLGTIKSKLGMVMVQHAAPTQRVDTLALENLIQDGRTVLCIFESGLNIFSVEQRVGSGIYLYDDIDCRKKGKQHESTSNYRLYDQYSNSRNPSRVMGDQWRKYRDRMEARVKGNEDEVFLLSWTVTLNPSPALMDMRSIVDHAKFLNGHLLREMEHWRQMGDIHGRERPNIIYVDAYDKWLVDVVARINALPL